MFGRLSGDPGNLAHLRRIEAALRVRYGLPAESLVLVREEPGRLPGFPPRQTVIRFWIGPERYRLTLFTPAAQVAETDLPVAWLLPSLRDDGEADCC
ncbi:hypothetical protein [Roseivivax sp. CAU 1761]